MRTTEHPEMTVVAGGGPEDAVVRCMPLLR